MKNQTIYDSYRLPSKLFFGLFLICLCAWFSRYIRITPSVLSGKFLAFRNAEWPVWMEHFAAALGLPAGVLAGMYWGVTRPHAERPWKNQVVMAFLMPIALGLLVMMLYAIGESGHEVWQLLLAKRSNYGQYLADHCFPAANIQAFANCSHGYQPIVMNQLYADAAGLLVFFALMTVCTYKLAIDHVKVGAIQLRA
jgi:hypothetical protein